MKEYWKVEDPTTTPNIYDVYVPRYWNWLLGRDANTPTQGNVLFMRIIYGYRNRWEIDRNGEPVMTRKNVSEINRMAEDREVKFQKDQHIFLPVIDTLEHDFDRDIGGNPLTPQLMNKMLDAENEDVLRKIGEGRVRSTIRRLDNDKDTTSYDIVPDLTKYRIAVPQGIHALGTFKLTVPSDSKLAQNLEFDFPKDTTVNARAQGIYLVFKINEKGRYQIRSSAEGLRGYRADMNYHISIE